uniref:Uncharacterized protein n=1 Tax=Clandestinovirus TaxID=2831644 RepID=A0A8F8PNI7_9VIRU|nr:hypothetical protein KOM_12_594 [Clandestinovirus]
MSDAKCDHSNVQKRRYYSDLNRLYFGDPELTLTLSALLSKQFDTSWLAVNKMKDNFGNISFSTIPYLPISKTINDEMVLAFKPEPEVSVLQTGIAIQLFMNVLLTDNICTPLNTVVLASNEDKRVTWSRPVETSEPLTKFAVDNPSKLVQLENHLKDVIQKLKEQRVRFPLLTLDMLEVVGGTVRIWDCRTLSSQNPSMSWKFMADLMKTDSRWESTSVDTDAQFVMAQWKMFCLAMKQ